jgi:hypothetical protein
LPAFLVWKIIDYWLGLKCKVVASLLYADTLPEAKMGEAEAPLLIRDEGVQFSSDDRPIKLLNGRSSFKLKISQVKITLLLYYLSLYCFSPTTFCGKV